jgi:DNA processing protein
MNINKILPHKHKCLQIIDTIDKSPGKLYAIGKLPTNQQPTVAIVGSRKPTAYGKEVTYRLAYYMVYKTKQVA